MHIEECELSDENEEESEEEDAEIDCSMTLQSRLIVERESASKNYEISPSSIISRGDATELGLKDSKRSILHEGSLIIPQDNKSGRRYDENAPNDLGIDDLASAFYSKSFDEQRNYAFSSGSTGSVAHMKKSKRTRYL